MQDILESRLGKVFIIIYTLFTIGTYILSFSCGASACSLAIIWPILPWAFILASDLGLTFPWAMYPIFVLLNASVAYVLGAGIEWLYHWFVDRWTTRDAPQQEHEDRSAASHNP